MEFIYLPDKKIGVVAMPWEIYQTQEPMIKNLKADWEETFGCKVTVVPGDFKIAPKTTDEISATELPKGESFEYEDYYRQGKIVEREIYIPKEILGEIYNKEISTTLILKEN
ncbi:MAG: hypothetical protein LBV67_04550 [Streptococcaceae bacterium]|jgi:hypothetical protein|nr:hypothetical protein [Streptococcaceae bacterium]